MTYQFPPDIEKLVGEHMASGGYTSEDDVLRDALEALGRFAHSREEADEEYRQTVADVREGVADMEAGRTQPLRAIIDEAHGRLSREIQ
jgi:Arc/MetJ-type ribon-helix-helix transcriptional regulator